MRSFVHTTDSEDPSLASWNCQEYTVFSSSLGKGPKIVIASHNRIIILCLMWVWKLRENHINFPKLSYCDVVEIKKRGLSVNINKTETMVI